MTMPIRPRCDNRTAQLIRQPGKVRRLSREEIEREYPGVCVKQDNRIPTASKPGLWMCDLPMEERNLRRTTHNIVVIYAITDPETGEIRYIGKTEKRLATRLWEHQTWPVNSGMRSWFEWLAKTNERPNIEPITCCSVREWEGKECYWIRWARIHGGRLLNRDPGGVCRNPNGSLNTYGKVKNYIARKSGKKAFVNDFVKKRKRRLKAFAKIDKRLETKWRA